MKNARRTFLLAMALAALSAVLLAAPGVASAHRFHGTVGAVHHSSRSFGLRTQQGSYRIYTDHQTAWDGCDWRWMQSGRHIGVLAHHRSGRWIAQRIAPWNDRWWGGGGGGCMMCRLTHAASGWW